MKWGMAIALILLAAGCTPSVVDKAVSTQPYAVDKAALIRLAARSPYQASDDKRLAALRELRKLKDPAIAHDLCDILYDENQEISEEAAWALIEIGMPGAEPVLWVDYGVTLPAAILIRIGPASIVPLAEHVNQVNEHLPEFVFERLGWEGAIEPLIKGLEDKDSYGQMQARLLGKVKSKQAVEPLIRKYYWLEGVEDINDARIPIVRALGEIKDPRALPVFLDALCQQDDFLAWEACRAMVDAKFRQAWPALVFAWQNGNHQQAAVWALGELGDKRALEYLRKKDDVSTLLARAKLGDKDVGKLAVAILKDPSRKSDQREAIEVLVALKDKTSAELILSKVTSDDQDLAGDAIEALQELEYEQAVPKLLPLLNDKTRWGVLEAAIRAMKHFKCKKAVPALRTSLTSGKYGPVEDGPTQIGHGGSDSVDFAIVDALVALEGEGATDLLVSIVEDKDSRWPSLRAWAVLALRDLHSPKAEVCKVKALGEGDEVSHFAWGALYKRPLHTPEARELLKKYKNDIRPWIADLAK